MNRVSWSVAGVGAAALSIAAAGVGFGWLLGSRGEGEGAASSLPARAAPARDAGPGSLPPATAGTAELQSAGTSPVPPYIASAPLPTPGAGGEPFAGMPSVPLPPGMPGGDATQRIQRLQELAARLDRMRQAGRVDAVEVDKILVELEKAWGSSEIAGIRIDTLRRNMQTANEALRLNEDIERLRNKKEPTEDERKALEAKQKELMELARRMNVGVVPALPPVDPTQGARAKP